MENNTCGQPVELTSLHDGKMVSCFLKPRRPAAGGHPNPAPVQALTCATTFAAIISTSCPVKPPLPGGDCSRQAQRLTCEQLCHALRLRPLQQQRRADGLQQGKGALPLLVVAAAACSWRLACCCRAQVLGSWRWLLGSPCWLQLS